MSGRGLQIVWVLFLIFVALCLLVVMALPAIAEATITGPARVVDGDTLEVQGQRVRLHGIDAPEIRQTCTRKGETWACGVAARRHLEELIGGQEVSCRPTARDRYGRVVARCFVIDDSSIVVGQSNLPHIDLGGWMVRNGHAVAYVKYSTDYLPQESVARGARVGIWAGTFVQPEQWRRGRR